MVFDVRFLPNPYFVAELKNLTGSDQAVVDYMQSHGVTRTFQDQLGSMLDFLLPEFKREGKSYLTIALGCTGGRHRSVMLINALADSLVDTGLKTKIIHRDVDKR